MNSSQDLLACLPDVVLVADPAGSLRQFSAEAQRTLGPAVAVGARVAALVHADDQAALERAWPAKTTPTTLTCRVRRADGAYRVFSWRLTRSGETVVASLRELSQETASAEDALHAGVLRVLLEHLPASVWAIDGAGNFIFHDGRGVDMVGMKRRELVGTSMFDGFWADDGLKRAMATGEVAQSVTQMFEQTWETWYCPRRDADGKPDGVVAISWSVDETRRLDLDRVMPPVEAWRKQELQLRELSTPIIQVWDKVLCLPVIGTVDDRRTTEVMERLLAEIVRTRSRFAILDLTGVDTVDTSAAGHLFEVIRAIRLLGAEGIVTGIRPTVAQTMVALGFDMSTLVTLSDLRGAIQHCMRQLAKTSARK